MCVIRIIKERWHIDETRKQVTEMKNEIMYKLLKAIEKDPKANQRQPSAELVVILTLNSNPTIKPITPLFYTTYKIIVDSRETISYRG